MFINKYVAKLRPYKLASHKVWEVSGKDEILKLDWNEATIPPSAKVIDSIQHFLMTQKLNWYPDTNNEKLLTALSAYNGIDKKNVQYFASSDALHEYILRTYIEAGDTITIIAPTYDNFRAVAESVGASINYFFLDDHVSFNYDKFYNFEKSNSSKLIYLCNPNNPTGTEYELALVKKALSDFPDKLFIIDEAYYEFTGNTAKELVERHDNIIITRTFSKAFALAGFRIGYMIASPNNIAVISTIRNPKNITSLSQVAAISALSDIQYMWEYVREVKKAKKEFESNLLDMKNKKIQLSNSGGGNFSLLKVNDSEKFIAFLESKNVFIRNYGHVNGMDGYVRITIGTSAQMHKVFGLIRNYFNGQ